ncbi:hypothetical protein HS088_TW19G00623 [Tripterygium wilfordii]|uniref:Uncharacterized protein n=1 Tax=Tripterygium wilfordii TaxID=458696 RepID=A0A7J7CA95_TRIWF|nr:uncharacterized protein LOC119986303 [Tripterygium wilfordii]KAF5731020.1 hypothetical protein HS088_TW19G00623 [Tripterygium wilfordii]
MVLLCFVLDLCSLPPPLLGDVKQSLLQLANYYAISSSSSRSSSLEDRIGLCYVFKCRISCSVELKIAYSPIGNFSLRNFHRAVNNLPSEAFLPEIDDSGALCCHDVKLSSVLSDQVLYSWGGKDVMRKVIVLSSCLPKHIDSAIKTSLAHAADKCVSVEFVLFEKRSGHLTDVQESINSFSRSISELDNCSLQMCLPDDKAFYSLVKRWLQDLKDDMEEPLQAQFIFKSNIVGSVNQITCNLYTSVNQIIDGFTPCQTCSCHGISLDEPVKNRAEAPSCPVTGHDLGKGEAIENSAKVGDKTILLMPSCQTLLRLQKVSSPIDFNIIEKTNLGSLSEGLFIGASYVVTPSSCHEMEATSDEIDEPELNSQIFQGLRSALHSMDQGLVCSSKCNMESMKEAAFHCYYILLPSSNGPMLLRRLAGSEEVLPVPDVGQLTTSSVTKEVENAIEDFLSKIETKDYNPVLHERGFHQKLNLLVKESLQFWSIIPPTDGANCELSPTQSEPSAVISQSNMAIEVAVQEENPQVNSTAKEDKTAASIAEEWEQLVVHEVPMIKSPVCITKSKLDHQSVMSPPDSNRQLDVKTSRILERLEVPKQLKAKVTSPTLTSNSISDTSAQAKKPLIPFQTIHASDKNLTSSQLIKPSFQRLKRKHV